MPTLIKLENGVFTEAADRFRVVETEDLIPDGGGVILPLARFEADGARLLDEGRPVGVLLQPDEQVEALAYDLPRIAVVALNFPKFRDGRGHSSAALLRTRFGFKGEVRAVGDVLREQAREMVRCGFDAFIPSDGSGSQEWAAAAGRYRHVYQTAADHRAPAFVERSDERHE
ncbi:MAG: DUF934 domain-containing protein [Pseudomonadota bacterium]|nr:DUF934 domain-containing protein [Pseudomonadota bacterium]